MSALAVVSLLMTLLVLLAVGCVVLLPFSLRPSIVTGPPWLGAVVVVSLLAPLPRAARVEKGCRDPRCRR